jgi:hypothetical protein
VTAIPAAFMSAVSMTYILSAREGLQIGSAIAYPIGIAFAVCLLLIYMRILSKKGKCDIKGSLQGITGKSPEEGSGPGRRQHGRHHQQQQYHKICPEPDTGERQKVRSRGCPDQGEVTSEITGTVTEMLQGIRAE